MKYPIASRAVRFYNSKVFWLILLFCGILLRLWYLRQYCVNLPSFDLAMGPDTAEYDLRAREILSGRFWSLQPAIHAPVYSLILAGLYRITGFSVPVVRFFQLFWNLFGWVLCYQAWIIGRIPRGVRQTAWLAAMLYPVGFFYQGELVSESMFLPLFGVISCLAMLEYRTAGKRQWCCAGGVGVGLGLLHLIHPLTGFITVFEVIRRCFTSGKLRICAVLGGAALVTGAYVIPAALHYHKFFPVQSNAAFNFFVGNRIDGDGGCSVRPGKNWRELHAAAERESKRRNISVSRYWLEKTCSEWLQDPGAAAQIILNKVLHVIAAEELISGGDAGYYVCKIPLVRYGSWFTFLIYGLAAVGCWYLFRSSYPPERRFYLWVFLAGATAQIVFVTAGRYRVMMLSAALILAAGEFCRFRRKKRKYALGILGMLLAASVLLAFNFPHTHVEEGVAMLAEAEFRKGNYGKAEPLLKSAGKMIDDKVRFNNMLGIIAEKRGDYRSAEILYREACKDEPDEALSWSNLGSLFSRNPAKQREAKACLEQAVQLSPQDPAANFNYALFLHKRGENCQVPLHRAVEAAPYFSPAWNLLGIEAASAGNLVLARDCFGNAAKFAPEEPGYRRNYEFMVKEIRQRGKR